jgi:hypothetical protein
MPSHHKCSVPECPMLYPQIFSSSREECSLAELSCQCQLPPIPLVYICNCTINLVRYSHFSIRIRTPTTKECFYIFRSIPPNTIDWTITSNGQRFIGLAYCRRPRTYGIMRWFCPGKSNHQLSLNNLFKSKNVFRIYICLNANQIFKLFFFC